MIYHVIHPVSPQTRILEQVVEIMLKEDGICVYPTDTVYGIGACASNPKAIDRIGRMLKKDKMRSFSFICSDFSQVSAYAKMSNRQFKLMKRYLPGPYTFILDATNYVPKKVAPKRRTVGIRIPDNNVCIELVRLLQEPLANTSISIPGQQRGDPEVIRPAVVNEVDVMLDSGALDDPRNSTVIDLTGAEPVVIREGKGPWHGC